MPVTKRSWKGIPLVITRKQIKNIYLRVVEPDAHLAVSCPARVTDGQIMLFLEEREEWIRRSREKILLAAHEKADVKTESPKEEAAKRRALALQLQRLIGHWEVVMGVRSAGFTIRKMKTRWGSCNVRTGHLNFNYSLAEKPERLVEYVVVHELTHLLEASHNERFWGLMEYYLPGSRSLRRELNGK